MKLYTYDPAPNPRRLRLFLDWKGIALETQQIDLRKLEQFEPAFRELNPRGVLPALQLDDGSLLCDALAIALYLEALHPQKPLFGRDALERARIVSWDQYVFTDAFLPAAEVLRNENPAFADRPLPGPLKLPQIPALGERGRLRLPHFFAELDRQLTGREFLVGDQLSFADIDALVMVDFAGWSKIQPAPELRELARWRGEVAGLLG